MDDQLLAAAAEAMGAPPEMVMRSAQARAQADGTTLEAVLTAWAGGKSPAPAAAEPEAEPPTPPMEEEAAPEEEAPPGEVTEPAAEPAPKPPEEATVPAAAPAPMPPAPPAVVSVERAEEFEVVTTVATASLKERTSGPIPRWLSSLFVLLPAAALLLLVSSGSPTCGESGSLGVDPVTGQIVNCDGSEFTGAGPGRNGGVDYVAQGRAIFSGAGACNGCHGAQGEGLGLFPALTAETRTFPTCTDHVRWVELGSTGWMAQVGPTYPNSDRRVGPGMPTFGVDFGGQLTDDQIVSVVMFERVVFSGQPLSDALVDCGLAEPTEPEEGATTTTPTETTQEGSQPGG